MRFALVLGPLSLAGLIAGCGDDTTPPKEEPKVDPACLPPITEADTAAAPAIATPRWAFEPWISKDISNRDDTYEFVDGFIERDIPVGVVVLDSPWETHYNTFIPNPERYADFPGMVDDMAERDVRVVLWVTQMVNSSSFDLENGGDSYSGPSPNFETGIKCDFFVNDGEAYGWWKGVGAGVDFFNPNAAAWWHRQQDDLLNMGVAGWKLDFGESYIPTETIETASGTVSHQAYSEKYYEDFYAYGAAVRTTDEFVTMVRPYDKSYAFEGRFFARPEHAPVAWVGDNRRDWVGLSDALDHIFRSAKAGYVVVGSDIGGYLDRNDSDLTEEVPPNADTFASWTAVGALTPFMQLHGRANVTPWSLPEVGDALLPVYRYWSKLHHEMVPFLFSLSAAAYAGEPPPIRPVGAEGDWDGDYRFHLGEAFLVAPTLDGSGSRDVEFPSGARYYDWWTPAADAFAGGQTLSDVDTSDSARIPLYVRQGAIVPLDVSDDVTGLGNTASKGMLTVMAYPGPSETSFDVYEDDGSSSTIKTSSSDNTSRVTLSQALLPVMLRVRSDLAPTGVSVGGAAATLHATRAALDAADSGWFYDAAIRTTWVKLPASSAETSVEIASTGG